MPLYLLIPIVLYALRVARQGAAETLMAGVAPGAGMVLPLGAMEQTFERLAAVAEGRPVVQEGLPESTEFAAALLILREFMHHLGFSAVHVGD